MQENIIEFDHVTKEYRLGAIGGGTLKGDLQSLAARIRGKEDPNLQIGQTTHTKNQRFLALDDVSFSVKKGERVGIIGHNGAGKSTLLKLLSRVTAPTKGTISYNGRIASMLEVGTGFHPELTGRENVYMNGAILGMTKAEISRKFDDIVRFAEMEQFIDTPVKRYSSGMYVKLAFAVAAHLDSDILVMDEVLAVGDMAFQKKCLDKMNDVSRSEGRTILYVSHNMNTIRQLCDRCIFMDHGNVVFDGDVEEAICLYLGTNTQYCNDIIISPLMRDASLGKPIVQIDRIHSNCSTGILQYGSMLDFEVTVSSQSIKKESVYLRLVLKSIDGSAITTSSCQNEIVLLPGEKKEKCYQFDVSNIAPGKYSVMFALYEIGKYGADRSVDVLRDIYTFTIDAYPGFNHDVPWNSQWWGNVTNGYLREQ